MPQVRRMHWLMGALAWLLCPVLLFSAPPPNPKSCEKGLTPDDVKAIKATIEAYRTSWLQGDAKGVLNTFAEDALLLPHHGDPPVQGITAIQNYWFGAGGPATTITGLKITVEQVGGSFVDYDARGEATGEILEFGHLSECDEEIARWLLANSGTHVGRSRQQSRLRRLS